MTAFNIEGIAINETDREILSYLLRAPYARELVNSFKIAMELDKSQTYICARLKFLIAKKVLIKSPQGAYHITEEWAKLWRDEVELNQAKLVRLLEKAMEAIKENINFAVGQANIIYRETGKKYTPEELVQMFKERAIRRLEEAEELKGILAAHSEPVTE